MNSILVGCILFGIAYARPQAQNPSLTFIVRYDYNLKDSGGYTFNVDTSDGFHHDADAELRNTGTQEEGLAVKGSYSYIGIDGVRYTVDYIADNDGFQPSQRPQRPEIILGGGVGGGQAAGGYSSGCSATLCGTGLG